MSVEIAAIIIVGGFLAFVFYKIVESAKKKSIVLEFAGQVAVAIDEINLVKEGFVLFHGEHWKAISESVIKPNQIVKITSRRGLTLTVEPIKEAS